MDQNSIRTYLEEHRILTNPTVEKIGFGESNANYLATSGDDKVIVRLARDDVPTEPRFEKEHHFMRFVESQDIGFAPRSIHYNPELHIHVTSYAEGDDASVIDLDDAQTRLFVQQLSQTNNLSHSNYTKWCNQQKLVPLPSRSYEIRRKENITDRLEYIANHEGEELADMALEWAQPKLERFYSLAEAVPRKETFFHGDLRWNKGGGNLRVDTNKIIFIDWELAGFKVDGMPEIADVIGSIPLEYTSKAIELYDLYKEHNSGYEAERALEYGVLWGKLGNPLWAVERYYLLKNDKNMAELERYSNLAKQGMNSGDEYFNKSFSEWFKSSKYVH